MRGGLPTSLFDPSHFDSLSFNLQTIPHIHLTDTYLHLTYTINPSYTMSRISAFREWITRRTSSLWPASQASKVTVNRHRRTEYPQTADGLPSSESTPPGLPHSPSDTWSHSSSVTLQDLEEELRYDDNRVPYTLAGIREWVKQTATYYVDSVRTEGRDSAEALKQFAALASFLEGKEDLGILAFPDTRPPRRKEALIAASAARTIHELQRCPTRDKALEYLRSEDGIRPSFARRLRATNEVYGSSSRPSDQHGSSTVQQGRTGRGP
jgi:hypothetical protein